MEMLHAARRRSEASAREARRYQEELGRSEGRLRAILDNSPSVIFLKDGEGRYLLANRRVEVLTGSTSDQLVGKADADFFPAEIAEQFRSNDRTVLERGRPSSGKRSSARSDGPHTYLSTKFPLRDAAGVDLRRRRHRHRHHRAQAGRAGTAGERAAVPRALPAARRSASS